MQCESYVRGASVDGTPKGLKVVKCHKVFSLAKISPKKVPNHSSEHYPPKLTVLRTVICHIFCRFEPK